MPFRLASALKFAFTPAPYNTSVSATDQVLTRLSFWTLLFGSILYPSYFPQPDTTRDEYAGCIEHEEYWDCPHVVTDEPLPLTISVLPQFYFCGLACCAGLLGWLYVSWKHQKNHQWLMNCVFFPALCTGVAGAWSSFGRVRGAVEGQYGLALKVAMVAPSVGLAVAAALGLWYHGVMFRDARQKLEGQPGALEKEKARDEES